MTTQDLYEKFNDLLLRNSWWQRFVNSQFIKMFAVMGSQIIYAAQVAAAKALTEGFISTATRRSSILAAAEDKGYVGRLITPATGTARVTNKTAESVALPLYSTLISDAQYPYMLMEPLTLVANEVRSGVAIKQLERQRITVVVDNETEFLSLTLSKELTARCAQIDVYVTEKGKEILWKHNAQFRLSKKNSRDYVMFYRPTEQIGIRFGDGSIGKMPGEGESILIDVWLSDGDITLVQGQTLTPTGDHSSLANKVQLVTDSPITNGTGFETTEETRNRAQYYVAYDEQVVWGGDYKHFLRTVISGMSWVNVWGESEQEAQDGHRSLANINTVFLCGHKPGMSQDEIGAAMLSALKNVPNDLNKSFRHVPTNEKPFTISLSGVATKTINLEEAKRKIRSALETGAGRDSKASDSQSTEDFNRVTHNKIWALVQETGLLMSFNISITGMSEVVGLNDFVYLDVENSTVELRY
ncbi:baseplate J/gp47 family protein [Pantoea agglomerans]|uniref:baseplate J/gp47 family protein n=1 Tax=Enterobacter agglomerans TaxID=549 RepID=UPI0030167473